MRGTGIWELLGCLFAVLIITNDQNVLLFIVVFLKINLKSSPLSKKLRDLVGKLN